MQTISSIILYSPRNEDIYSDKPILFALCFVLQCQTLNEEDIFEVQDKRSLFPLGWIHVSGRIDFFAE